MRGSLRSALIVVVTGFVSTAWGAAPWCTGFNKANSDAHGDLKDLQERDDPRWAIPALVDATCAPDADLAKQQPAVAAARDRWSKQLDMTDADWVDAVAYAMMDRYADGLRFKNMKKAWSTFDAVDQYLSLTDSYGYSGDISHDKNYLADAFGSRLTELGRAGYLLYCIGRSEEKVVQWAMCAGDAAKLDWKQVAVDLRSTKAYDGADKMRIRLALLPLRQKLAEHPAAVKKLVAKDPGFAKVFELAERTFKEWTAGRAAEATYLEAAAAMDDARVMNSRSGFQDCQQKVWPVWRG